MHICTSLASHASMVWWCPASMNSRHVRLLATSLRNGRKNGFSSGSRMHDSMHGEWSTLGQRWRPLRNHTIVTWAMLLCPAAIVLWSTLQKFVACLTKHLTKKYNSDECLIRTSPRLVGFGDAGELRAWVLGMQLLATSLRNRKKMVSWSALACMAPHMQ